MNTIVSEQVLIITHKLSNCLKLVNCLENDYSINTLSSEDDVIYYLYTNPVPQLIILDISTNIDELSICVDIKKDDKFWKIPIIVVTMHANSQIEELALEAGALDFLPLLCSPNFKLRINNQLNLIKQINVLEGLVNIDYLTKIPNRKYFDEQLYSEWNRICRNKSNEPLSILLIDIDNFKQYNDYYGHAAGDLCLQLIAKEMCSSLVRSYDVLARLGGEEFGVILPKTDIQSAKIVAERIRKNVEDLLIPHIKSTTGNIITISLGVASFPTDTQTVIEVADLYDVADKNMYKAKMNGRNQVYYS